jgi:DNA-binding SARP family transcriptional activator
MEHWTVRLLGPSEAERNCVHAQLRSRLTWCVLGSLLLAWDTEPHGWVSRKELIHRFWPDSNNSRASLRQALASLRSCFGEGCVESSGDTVRIRAELFRTDIVEVAAVFEEALSAPTLEERRTLLIRVDALLRGEFLEGCDDPEEGVVFWIGGMRARWKTRAAEMLFVLARASEALGNPHAAFDSACRAVRFNPENREAWKVVWRLGRVVGRTPDAHALHGALTFPEAVSRIAARERRSTPLIVREERAFHILLEARLDSLPPGLRTALERLSVLPAAFRADHAHQACSVRAKTLKRLTSLQLLEQSDNRYAMLDTVRRAVWARVPADARHSLLTRQTDTCRSWLEYPDIRKKGRFFVTLAEAEPHIRQVIEHQLTLAPKDASYGFLGAFSESHIPWYRAEIIKYNARAAENESLNPLLRQEAAQNGALLCMEVSDFQRAAALASLSLDLCPPGHTGWKRACIQMDCARACHHAGMEMEALEHVRAARAVFHDRMHKPGEADALRFEGEILRAMGEFVLSAAVIDEALSLLRDGAARTPLQIAEALYQSAVTKRLLGMHSGAITDMEESLQLRFDQNEENGVADCLRTLAALKSDEGESLTSRAHLKHAILLYERCGNVGGRAAALEALSKIPAKASQLVVAFQMP